MSKKNVIYIIVLVVLVLIFALTKMNNKVEKRIDFFAVDSADVKTIKISNQEDTLHLVFADNKWNISYPVDYEAKEQRVEDFFEKALKAQTSKMPISISESSHETYNITDSLATHVELLDSKNKTLTDVYIGKSENGRNSFARNKGEKKVYQLLENIAYNINPKLSTWRDKNIFKYEADEISKIKIATEGNQYSLTFADTIWVYDNGKDSFNVNTENKDLKNLLTSLTNYNASDFKDDMYEQYATQFEKPYLQVEITTFENDKMQLRYIKAEDDKKFILQKNDLQKHLYLIYDNLVNKFEKTKEDFQK
ncbi:MAG: DUF4340 domain-containing protein [Candidatus Cloacimonetes bacterium]|nr:DUF4340 domain-containing protein [Candidatus Cloacimonadota bacterium]